MNGRSSVWIARALSLLAAAIWLIPYAWMALSSFKPLAEITQSPLSPFPHAPTLGAYREVFAAIPVGRYLLTSTVVAVLIALFQIALSLPAGYALANADITILAERPKLKTFKPAMAEALARITATSPAQFNLKAGTNEGCDAIGRGEAIAAHAVVLLVRQ